jgi:FAD/FMN-containing dehydrogenase
MASIAQRAKTETRRDDAVRIFAEQFSGEIVRPGSAGYDRARRVWNAGIDRHPALVVRPRDAADVVQAVNFARAQDLPLAVRSGGHSPAGHGTVGGGLVVDLSGMKGISIDAGQRVASVQPGLTWGEYGARAQEFGLATPSGDSASVGVGGLTLGGGIGWLARTYGLTIDSLLSAEVVTADGRLLTASPEEHPDLFWALRGGGGNIGIATEFRFRLHPVGTILGGALVYPPTAEVLSAYAAAAMAAPDELTTLTFVMQAPPYPFVPAAWHGRPVMIVTVCYVGDPEAGWWDLAPFRELAGVAPIVDATRAMPYPALYDLTAEGGVSRPHAIRAGFLRDLDPATIEAIAVSADRMTSPLSLIQLRVLGGAMARVPAAATAFAHRDKPFLLAAINGWDDPLSADADRHVAWTEGFWREIAPRTDGAYVNFLGDEGEERVRAAYPAATYDRLAAIKRRYDPDNLFRLNQNIRPG